MSSRDIDSLVPEDIFRWMVNIRRSIHQYPELGYQEYRTASLIARELKNLGLEIKTDIAQTGIIAYLNHSPTKPTIAFRADMDALPIQEDTGLPFSSQIPGIMHACGHDGHIAMVLATAALLKVNPPALNIVFLFQPAEEGGAGARSMLESGAFKDINAIFTCHLDPHFLSGQAWVQSGPVTAFTERFIIEIEGQGGHSARPQETIDAILVASQLVMSLQTIVSRQIDPAIPAVLSIGQLEAGTAFNVIASSATLKGTLRTTDLQTKERIKEAVERMVKGVASLYRAGAKIRFDAGYPAVINSEFETHLVREAILRTLGEEALVEGPYLSLGGEDFAYFLQRFPGCLFRLGCRRPGEPLIPTHNPSFDFDEGVMALGAAIFAELAHLYPAEAAKS